MSTSWNPSRSAPTPYWKTSTSSPYAAPTESRFSADRRRGDDDRAEDDRQEHERQQEHEARSRTAPGRSPSRSSRCSPTCCRRRAPPRPFPRTPAERSRSGARARPRRPPSEAASPCDGHREHRDLAVRPSAGSRRLRTERRPRAWCGARRARAETSSPRGAARDDDLRRDRSVVPGKSRSSARKPCLETKRSGSVETPLVPTFMARTGSASSEQEARPRGRGSAPVAGARRGTIAPQKRPSEPRGLQRCAVRRTGSAARSRGRRAGRAPRAAA